MVKVINLFLNFKNYYYYYLRGHPKLFHAAFETPALCGADVQPPADKCSPGGAPEGGPKFAPRGPRLPRLRPSTGAGSRVLPARWPQGTKRGRDPRGAGKAEASGGQVSAGGGPDPSPGLHPRGPTLWALTRYSAPRQCIVRWPAGASDWEPPPPPVRGDSAPASRGWG